MENYLFIVNPVSGNTNKGTLVNAIARNSLLRGFNYSLLYTTGENDKKLILHYINLLKPSKVIVMRRRRNI